jgi:hypothetical protein
VPSCRIRAFLIRNDPNPPNRNQASPASQSWSTHVPSPLVPTGIDSGNLADYNLGNYGNVDILQLLFSNSLPGSHNLQASPKLMQELSLTDFGLFQANPAAERSEIWEGSNHSQVTSSSRAIDDAGVPIRNPMDHRQDSADHSRTLDGTPSHRSSGNNRPLRNSGSPGVSGVHLADTVTGDRGQGALYEASSVLSQMVGF